MDVAEDRQSLETLQVTFLGLQELFLVVDFVVDPSATLENNQRIPVPISSAVYTGGCDALILGAGILREPDFFM
jgi:hypothetical protein